MTAQTATRLTIKIDGNEIQVEGPPEMVRGEMDHVLDRLLGASQGEVEVSLRSTPDDSAAASTGSEEERRLDELFQRQDPDTLVLRRFPKTRAWRRDTFLLFLYGMERLGFPSPVSGSRLLRGARASGMRIERVPRTVCDDGLVAEKGRRRGKSYRLTKVGKRHCQGLLDDLFAS